MPNQADLAPHISVVDDDESLRLALVSLLRSLGFTASGFGSAEEFLDSPDMTSSACLITDIHMPGMNGIELKHKMTHLRAALPVIMITARSEPELREKALASGAVCVLMKPFDAEKLASCIGQALE
ncbi:response regulator [Ferrovibrio sp.]|uniref:response regulator transcription factor n=1 Tax=Ferrovibrio sp. TaxID=1917215 RepID=UPI0025B9CD9C|nr:response regulator [Ferrovibrio sp.]MBX3456338.1 response regulator [Ferrovibrio sp.]